jgi:hypothetical protein
MRDTAVRNTKDYDESISQNLSQKRLKARLNKMLVVGESGRKLLFFRYDEAGGVRENPAFIDPFFIEFESAFKEFSGLRMYSLRSQRPATSCKSSL